MAFDPDAYLSKSAEVPSNTFDPDAYLGKAEESVAKKPQEPELSMPSKEAVEGVRGAALDVASMVTGTPEFIASWAARSVIAPVESVRGWLGVVGPNESRDAMARASEKAEILTHPLRPMTELPYNLDALIRGKQQATEQGYLAKGMSNAMQAITETVGEAAGVSPENVQYAIDSIMLGGGGLLAKGKGKPAAQKMDSRDVFKAQPIKEVPTVTSPNTKPEVEVPITDEPAAKAEFINKIKAKVEAERVAEEIRIAEETRVAKEQVAVVPKEESVISKLDEEIPPITEEVPSSKPITDKVLPSGEVAPIKPAEITDIPKTTEQYIVEWGETAKLPNESLKTAKTVDEAINVLKKQYGPKHFASILLDKLKPVLGNPELRIFKTREELEAFAVSHGADSSSTRQGFRIKRDDGSEVIGLHEGRASPEIVIHEVIHSALSDVMKIQGKYFKELQKLYTDIETSFAKNVDKLTEVEQQRLAHVIDKVRGGQLHELNAYGLTSPEVISALHKLDVTGKKNYVTKFIDWIAESLGLDREGKTALKRLFEVTETGVSEGLGTTKVGEKITKTKSVVESMESTGEIPKPREVAPEDMESVAKSIYSKHGEEAASKFYDDYQAYKKTWVEPIAETEKVVGINLQSKLANERVIHNAERDIKKAIPDVARREAISIAVDKGDLSGLSVAEKAIAAKYQADVKAVGERAQEVGVLSGLIENYVTHIIDWAGAPKGAKEEFLRALLGTAERDPNMQGMSPDSKFAKARKLKTFGDLERYIELANTRINHKAAQEGRLPEWQLRVKTKDIAEIYKEYALSMEKATENKKLIDSIQTIRNTNGESLVKDITKEEPLPHGWEVGEGQLAGKAIHPDLMPALKFVFDAGPGEVVKALGNISQLVKRINVVGSFFHAKSLMEVMSSAQVPIWTPLKEAVVLPLVEKGVKAMTGKDLQLSAISKAVDQYHRGGLGDNVDKWIKDGKLQLEVPEDVSKGVLTETGKFGDSLIARFGPKTRVLEKSLSTIEKYTLGMFDKYTWDYLHTGGKILVADAYLTKAREAASREGRPFDEVKSREEIGKFVNESFGGLNWFEAAKDSRTEFGKRMAQAAFNPAGRRGMQIALFAPDWTISTIRAFSASLPKELNPTKWHPVEGIKGMANPTTKADYARLYQFKTALTYFTLLNAINMVTANRPIWENKDPSRIEFPDGTSMQAMKHAMEPYHWIADPDKTLTNKLGFIPKAVIVSATGVEYPSPHAQKLVDPSAVGRGKAVAAMALPFQAQAASGAPPGEGTKRAILGTMGLPVYGSTEEQKKATRAEREKELKRKAKEYHEKARTKGWE